MDLFLLNNRKSDVKRPQITRLPQSSVVDRLKCFLPEMAAANAELDQQIESSPEEYNIENVSESDERVIEMNIAVIERDDDDDDDDDDSPSNSSSDESDHDSDGVEGNSDNHDRDNVASVHCEKNQEIEATRSSHELRRIKMPKTSSSKCRSRPCIEVLPSSVQDTSNDQSHS